jgi:DNA polymerase elongation subunit (family B)
VVHNTDSVMVNFPGATPTDADTYAKRISETVTARFRAPMKLEHERTAMPMLMLTKKMYAFLADDTIIVKGLSIKRRDYPPFIRETLNDIVTTLLRTSNVERALEVFTTALTRLAEHKVPYTDLVLSKELRNTTYVGATKPPHATVADKMKARDSDTAPKTGDHVAFVIVASRTTGGTIGEQAEDPEWAARHNLRPDFGYYTKLLTSQTHRIFDVCGVGRRATAAGDTMARRAAALIAGQTLLPWAPERPLLDSPPQLKQKDGSPAPPPKKQSKLTSFFH